MIEADKFWDKVADKYAKRPISDEATYQKKLELTRRYFTVYSEVLEFGCGTGSTALLHAPYVKQITAIDFSQKMIDIAREKLVTSELSNIGFNCSSLSDASLGNASFDAVLGLNVLHLIDDYPAAIERSYDLLKPGGVFVTSTACLGASRLFKMIIPLMVKIGKAPKVQFILPEELEKEMAAAGFTIVERLSQKLGLFLIAKKP